MQHVPDPAAAGGEKETLGPLKAQGTAEAKPVVIFPVLKRFLAFSSESSLSPHLGLVFLEPYILIISRSIVYEYVITSRRDAGVFRAKYPLEFVPTQSDSRTAEKTAPHAAPAASEIVTLTDAEVAFLKHVSERCWHTMSELLRMQLNFAERDSGELKKYAYPVTAKLHEHLQQVADALQHHKDRLVAPAGATTQASELHGIKQNAEAVVSFFLSDAAERFEESRADLYAHVSATEPLLKYLQLQDEELNVANRLLALRGDAAQGAICSTESMKAIPSFYSIRAPKATRPQLLPPGALLPGFSSILEGKTAWAVNKDKQPLLLAPQGGGSAHEALCCDFSKALAINHEDLEQVSRRAEQLDDYQAAAAASNMNNRDPDHLHVLPGGIGGASNYLEFFRQRAGALVSYIRGTGGKYLMAPGRGRGEREGSGRSVHFEHGEEEEVGLVVDPRTVEPLPAASGEDPARRSASEKEAHGEQLAGAIVQALLLRWQKASDALEREAEMVEKVVKGKEDDGEVVGSLSPEDLALISEAAHDIEQRLQKDAAVMNGELELVKSSLDELARLVPVVQTGLHEHEVVPDVGEGLATEEGTPPTTGCSIEGPLVDDPQPQSETAAQKRRRDVLAMDFLTRRVQLLDDRIKQMVTRRCVETQHLDRKLLVYCRERDGDQEDRGRDGRGGESLKTRVKEYLELLEQAFGKFDRRLQIIIQLTERANTVESCEKVEVLVEQIRSDVESEEKRMKLIFNGLEKDIRG
eukprot:g2330.t1